MTVDTDSATDGAQNTLSFSTSNWNTGQTVTVSAAEDDNTTNETVTLSHSASGGGYDTVSQTLVVTVADTDMKGLALNPPTLTVVEASSATYMVQLTTEPTGMVTVTVGGAGSDVTVSPASLSFSPQQLEHWPAGDGEWVSGR